MRVIAVPHGAPAALPAPAGEPVHAVIRWSFYLFVASIPFDLPRNPLGIELPTLTGALLIASTMLQPARCYRRLPAALWCFGAFLFALTTAFAANGGRYPLEARNLLVSLVQLIWLFWIALNLLRDDVFARRALGAFVVACALRAAVQFTSIGATTPSSTRAITRMTAFGQNADFLAGIWALGLLVALDLAYRGGARIGPRRLVLGVLIGTLAYTIMETGSRGALVALLAGLAIYLGGRVATQFRLRDAGVALVVLAGVAGFGFTSETMRHRMMLTVVSGNLAGRERIYPELLAMFVERPLVGWGPIANKYELAIRLVEVDRWQRIARREGLATEAGRDPRWLRRDAHNVVLEAATAGGLATLLPLAAGVALCLIAAWRGRRGPRGMLPLAALTLVFAFNQSENRLAGKLEWLVLAYALASAPPTRAGGGAPSPHRRWRPEVAVAPGGAG